MCEINDEDMYYDDDYVERVYTDKEKENNYTVLCDTVEYVTQGGRITEDWIYEQIELLRFYRQHFFDLRQIDDHGDPDFRKLLELTEDQFSTLLKQFAIPLFMDFIVSFKHIVDRSRLLCVDDLCDTFKKL
jgi:hypothetical protein